MPRHRRITCKRLSINAKSSFVLALSDAGPRRLAAASRRTRHGLSGFQGDCRHPALHLPGIHYDQRRTGVRNRQVALALLHRRLLHRHGHRSAAVAADRPLLYFRTAALRPLDRLRGVEGESAAEPFRGPDLGRHPLHDARRIKPEKQLDIP